MSGQSNGWDFKSPVPYQMNNGFPMPYQSSRSADDYVNTAPPTPAPKPWWPAPSCSPFEHHQPSKHHGKHRSQAQQSIQPALTTIVPNSNLAIPVLSSVRREKRTFADEKKEVKEVEECNNNNVKADESTEPALLFCSMCVGKTSLGEEALRRHLKIHYDAMFKCGVCRQEKHLLGPFF